MRGRRPVGIETRARSGRLATSRTGRRWDSVWVGLRVATMVPGGRPYGALEEAAVGIRDGRIAWVGPARELPGPPEGLARNLHRGGGAWMTPGLVDCHTHLVFAGDRADEFARRRAGATYEEIAREGGGIRATVRATRAATEDELFVSAVLRLGDLLAEGVTTVEVKSGYGLDLESELKMLRVARRLERGNPVSVRTSLLAAHALPEEYEGRRGEYLALIREEMIPRAARMGLADAVDAFCEGIAFSPDECGEVFRAAAAHGLPCRLHADQLSDLGGAALAARHRALSADHLEHTSEGGVHALADAGTVAVLLPGAFHFLGETRAPPVEALREASVPMAVATDCNPGTSPLTSLLMAMSLASTHFGLLPEECLAGVTRHGARALGLDDRGTIQVGKRADLVVWDIEDPAELSYWMGRRPVQAVIKDGEVVRPS